MKNYLMAGIGGTLAGILVTTQLAGPLVAQESGRNTSVYEQLDLFGNVFERVQQDYVEQVDSKKLIEAAINYGVDRGGEHAQHGGWRCIPSRCAR